MLYKQCPITLHFRNGSMHFELPNFIKKREIFCHVPFNKHNAEPSNITDRLSAKQISH